MMDVRNFYFLYDTFALIMTDSGRNELVFIAEIIKLYAVGSLTLREERRLRVSESRVLRRIFGPKRDEVMGIGENYIMRSLMICTPHPKFFG
jgi:hypothetical protein